MITQQQGVSGTERRWEVTQTLMPTPQPFIEAGERLMKELSARDPRTDPMRGDILKKHGVICVVRRLESGKVCYLTPCGAGYDGNRGLREWCNTLSLYRRWAADATVIHKGEDL